MKKPYLRMIFVAASLVIASCSQENVSIDVQYSNVPITFMSELSTESVSEAPATLTRAVADPTKSMELFFVRADETASKVYGPYGTDIISYTRATGTGAQPMTNNGAKQYYLISGLRSKLTGWYPAATSFASGVASWTIDGTQDILTASELSGSAALPIENFLFKHRLTQLQFKVRASDDSAIAAWGSITSITLKSQPTTGRYTVTTDASTGNVVFGTTPVADFTVRNIANTPLTLTSTSTGDPMMIAPQPAGTKLTLTITSSTGLTTDVEIANATYEVGKAYNIGLRFKSLGEIEGTASIGNWAIKDKPEQPIVPKEPGDLSENGSANCYIISSKTQKDYYFDATVRGNNAIDVSGINYGSLPSLTGAAEARVIWQTGTSATSGLVIDPTSLMLDAGTVRFSLGTAKEGNAVIGLFASSLSTAPCLWSWHIWRVDGPLPADVECVKTPSPKDASATFKMMALNLGAFNNTPANGNSVGLLYQWGRKDPFPGAPVAFNSTEPTNIYGSWNTNSSSGKWNGSYTIQTQATSSTIGTEAWAVQFPTIFIINTAGTQDWIATKNDALWGNPWVAGGEEVGGNTYNNSQGTKSIYDPCPPGYRVPPQDTWNKLESPVDFNYGYAFTGMVPVESFWFPAAGWRLGKTGALEKVTGNGYYWSSSPHALNNAYSSNMYITNGYGLPIQYNFRSYGGSVRCVHE